MVRLYAILALQGLSSPYRTTIRVRIDDFINSETQAGDYDSAGAFTIDLNRGMELRSQYTLERPELWVLKFLQSMTRFGAQALDVRRARNTLVLRAKLDVSTFQDFPLLQLFQLQDDPMDPRTPLREALWSSLAQGREVTIAWWKNTIPHAMTFRAEGARICPPPSHLEPGAFQYSVRSLKSNATLKSVLGLNPFASELREIKRAGVTLPYQLRLQGKVQDPIRCLRSEYGREFEVRFQRASSGPRFRLTHGHEAVSFAHRVQKSLLSPGDEFRYFLVLTLDPKKTQIPTVTWMVDGVGIQSENLTDHPSALGLRLYLPGSDLTTDISGLSIRQNPEKADRLQKFAFEALTDMAVHLPIALVGTLPKKYSRRVELLNLTLEMRDLLDRCALTIGVYGGHHARILGSLGERLAESETRLKEHFFSMDKTLDLDVASLRDLASQIAL